MTPFLLAALLSAPAAAEPEVPGCAGFAEAHARDGEDYKRLALLVGVGEYAAEHVTDLRGPPNDVATMHQLLTDPDGGYGFPVENVCALVNSEATLGALRETWAGLTAATNRGDVVFFYFAGHGSQTEDRNSDETDGMDETLMLHDARTPGVFDLIDDEFNQMIRDLHDRDPEQLVIGLDSCNSGSATRGENDAAVARMFVTERPETYDVAPSMTLTGEVPLDALSNTVLLSAARDGTGAMELSGRGLFTQALTESLANASTPMTWSQVSRQVVPKVGALALGQKPVVQGSLDAMVFNSTHRDRPLSAEVVATSIGEVLLSGTALPGWGPDAVVRVYSGAAASEEVDDPSKAVAVLRVTEYRQLTATASLESGDITTIHAGDLAVLAKRSPETVQIGVRVDGSVPPMTRAAFEASLSERSGAARQVVISDATDAFSLERPPKGGLLLRGPEGTVRDRVDQPYEAADSLVLHARQRALMALSGEGGQFLVDGESLEIWLTPHEEQPFACSGEPWVQACPGEEQVLPLCTRWAIHVRNRSGSNLRVGGAVLWNDGQMLPLPEEGREVLLGPGQQDTLFNAELVTTPPLEALEHVVVVGTNHRERINWQALASAADSRAGSSMRTRPWTVSHLDMRVTANPRLEPPPLRIWRGGEGRDVGQVGACVASEPAAITAAASALYLEPYLPSVSTAPLARVLEAAHGISLRAESIPSTIDGATAIRAAFAEAGVAYTGGDAASLTKPVGPDRFEGCLDAPPATGDLWVHDRDGDVSATLVLDPSRSVAWDGQGYRRVDGAPVACWRHSDFVGPGARGGEREVPMCWDRAETCCATPEACEGW